MIVIENMTYREAIDVLNNIRKYEDEKIIASAIYKIIGMKTIMAVNKDALFNAVKWLFNKCYEIVRD